MQRHTFFRLAYTFLVNRHIGCENPPPYELSMPEVWDALKASLRSIKNGTFDTFHSRQSALLLADLDGAYENFISPIRDKFNDQITASVAEFRLRGAGSKEIIRRKFAYLNFPEEKAIGTSAPAAIPTLESLMPDPASNFLHAVNLCVCLIEKNRGPFDIMLAYQKAWEFYLIARETRGQRPQAKIGDAATSVPTVIISVGSKPSGPNDPAFEFKVADSDNDPEKASRRTRFEFPVKRRTETTE